MNIKDIILGKIDKVANAGNFKNTIEITNEIVLVNTDKNISNTGLIKTMTKDYISNMGEIVGYVIKNVGDFTIKGIQIPNYRINPKTNKAEGGVIEVDLRPGKAMDIPTKWLALLLSRLEYMGNTKNGKFTPTTKIQNSIDEYFNSFRFSKELSPIVIGIYNVNTHKAKIIKEARDVFCYLENNSKLVDVKITKKTAIMLGLLLRKEK